MTRVAYGVGYADGFRWSARMRAFPVHTLHWVCAGCRLTWPLDARPQARQRCPHRAKHSGTVGICLAMFSNAIALPCRGLPTDGASNAEASPPPREVKGADSPDE